MDSQELSSTFEKTAKNEYLFWLVMLFGIVFGWLARPPIPNWLLKLFENPVFQYIVLFGIVYTGSKNVKAAFISPLIFMFLMYLLSLADKKQDTTVGVEGFYNRNYQNIRGGQLDIEEENNNNEEDPDEYDNVDPDEVMDEEQEEEFADQDTEQERRKLAFDLHKGISDVSKSSSELYQTATSLVDTYAPDFEVNRNRRTNNIKSNTTEGFF